MSSQTPLTATSLPELCPTDRNFRRRNKPTTRPPVSTETTLKRWGRTFLPSTHTRARLRKTKVLQDIISRRDVPSSRRNGEEIIQKFLSRNSLRHPRLTPRFSPHPPFSACRKRVPRNYIWRIICNILHRKYNFLINARFFFFFCILQKISEITWIVRRRRIYKKKIYIYVNSIKCASQTCILSYDEFFKYVRNEDIFSV